MQCRSSCFQVGHVVSHKSRQRRRAAGLCRFEVLDHEGDGLNGVVKPRVEHGLVVRQPVPRLVDLFKLDGDRRAGERLVRESAL